MVRLVWLVAFAACGRINFDVPCEASAFIDACTPAGDDLVLDGGEYVYDTDAGTLRGPNGLVPHVSRVTDGVRIVAASATITATARLRGIGTLPLAIAGGEIDIAGELDVSGHGDERGAGGEPCDASTRRGSDDTGGAGGGGGGGFGAGGGDGSGGDADDTGVPV